MLENLQKSSSSHSGLQPNSQVRIDFNILFLVCVGILESVEKHNSYTLLAA